IDGDDRESLCRQGGRDGKRAEIFAAARAVPIDDDRPAARRFGTRWQEEVEEDIVRALHNGSAKARADGRDEFLGRLVVRRGILPKGKLPDRARDSRESLEEQGEGGKRGRSGGVGAELIAEQNTGYAADGKDGAGTSGPQPEVCGFWRC